jgi:hypothetical protein
MKSNAQWQSLGQLIVVTLILLLSYELVQAKREAGSLRGEIARSTAEFVREMPLSAVPIKLATGIAGTLTDQCRLHKPLVVILSSGHCAKCEALATRWMPLVHQHPEMQFVMLSVDGPSSLGSTLPAQVISTQSSPGAVSSLLHVQHLPAVIETDSTCRITAAGAGMTSSEAILEALAASPSP